MAELSREKMLKKYRFLTNTTKSAIEKRLPVKELPCSICGKPIAEIDCEANVNKGTWTFFHNQCVQ